MYNSIIIKKVNKDTELADQLLNFVKNFSWEDVKEHTIWMINNWVLDRKSVV